MKFKFFGVAALLLSLAVFAYLKVSGDDPVAGNTPVAEHAHEAEPARIVIPVVNLEPPTDGFLCSGRFSVNVPGDEQEYPEAFRVQLAGSESEAIVEGLWPSPQFLQELEPPYWELLRQDGSATFTLTGIGLTAKTSLTSTLSIDQTTGEYGIFWSVFPVGFQTPVELWLSAGQCESFGMAGGK